MATRTNLLAVGVTELAGTPFTTLTAAGVTLSLIPAVGAQSVPTECQIVIQQQNGAAWTNMLSLGGNNGVIANFYGIGTYRPYRYAQNSAVGLDITVV